MSEAAESATVATDAEALLLGGRAGVGRATVSREVLAATGCARCHL